MNPTPPTILLPEFASDTVLRLNHLPDCREVRLE